MPHASDVSAAKSWVYLNSSGCRRSIIRRGLPGSNRYGEFPISGYATGDETDGHTLRISIYDARYFDLCSGIIIRQVKMQAGTMSEEKPKSKELMLDPSAASASADAPAFLSRPLGAPVYHGFPLVPETSIDGWCYGAITAFTDASGCTEGDGFVQAPDGTRAGLVWDVGVGEMQEISRPDRERWGVYQVWFPRAVHNLHDLCDCFAHILPALRAKHAELKTSETA
jgi:hypothetical protein